MDTKIYIVQVQLRHPTATQKNSKSSMFQAQKVGDWVQIMHLMNKKLFIPSETARIFFNSFHPSQYF